MSPADRTSRRASRAAPERPPREPTHATERNQLLRALPRKSYERLRPQLEAAPFTSGQVIWEAGAPIRSIYFPRSCVTSLLVVLEDDAPVECATVGREGMLGVPVALGGDSTSARAIAQVAGDAARLPVAFFREALAKDDALASLMLRYAQALFEQASQSVACNRRHSMDERCARWLLMTHDRVGADHFSLTHEFLAFMLGTRRASVTVAAGMLQAAGLIRYTRGHITVLDRVRLEEASCECYRRVREKTAQLLGEVDA